MGTKTIKNPVSGTSSADGSISTNYDNSAVNCFSFDLVKYPALDDDGARRVYEAHKYLLGLFRKWDNDVQIILDLEKILQTLDEGFNCTKTGQIIPPHADEYTGVTHVIENDLSLTVIISCKDGYLREKKTVFKVPTNWSNASDCLRAARYTRVDIVNTSKSLAFVEQLNQRVDEYCGLKDSGGGKSLQKIRSKKKGATRSMAENNSASANSFNDLSTKHETTSKPKRSRFVPRFINILGHCSLDDFVSGSKYSAILYFQTNLGTTVVSVNAAGPDGYKCNLAESPVHILSSIPNATVNESSSQSETTALNSSDVQNSKNLDRINSLIELLSRLEKDCVFAGVCSKLMGCDRMQLTSITLERLRAELETYT